MRSRCRRSRGGRACTLGVDAGAGLVAVLPGSRRSEIQYNAPPFLQAAALMHARRPDLRFVLPLAPGLRTLVEPLLAVHAPGLPIRVPTAGRTRRWPPAT
jgi:lipid-A-disaccharide synthase